MQGDNGAALEFLKAWGYPHVLSAVDPERKQGMLTYDCPNEQAAARVLAQWNGKRNLYFTVNRAAGYIGEDGHAKKPKKEHMDSAVALHVDIDPEAGKDIAEEQARILGILSTYDPPPSVVVYSGGGYQGFWLLDQPLQPADAVEPYNRGIEKALGGDNCFNVDRIMRVPGSVNLPDAKKRAKGRAVATAAVVRADWALRYALDAFTPWVEPAKAAKPRGVGKGDADWMMRVLRDGPDKEGPHSYGGDRSRAMFAVACALIRSRGWSVEQVTAALLDRSNKISDHVYDQSNPEKYAARQAERAADEASRGITTDDFWAYMPRHSYIYTPTNEMWPASSVNTRLGRIGLFNADGTPRMAYDKKGEPTGEQETVAAATWLDWNRHVEQMTWAPGLGEVIRDRHISEGGWFDKPGVSCYNQYRPPIDRPGDPAKAQRWIDHILKVYPTDAGHLIRYFAQRVQQPEVKPNHAIVLGGSPGIGKDTMLEPVKQAVGPWNFSEITPQHMLGRFNGFVKSVILRISEARDLEVNRYQFYDHTKIYTASPPDVLRVDEKHVQEYAVTNCMGVIITTNYKTNGIYLPADDRRHYVAWSDCSKDDFDEAYWRDLWGWYLQEGFGHVAAYLRQADLADYDPKAPPPKTEAFWAIADANRSPEDGEMAQVLEDMGDPMAVTLDGIARRADDAFRDWLRDRRNRKAVPHRLEQCGYEPIRNRDAKDGLWKIGGKRQVVYVRQGVDFKDQWSAAQGLGRGNENVIGGGNAPEIPF